MKKFLLATVVALLCVCVSSCGSNGSKDGKSGYTKEEIFGSNSSRVECSFTVKEEGGKLVVTIPRWGGGGPTIEVGHLRYVNTDDKPAVGDDICVFTMGRREKKRFYVFRANPNISVPCVVQEVSWFKSHHTEYE